MLQQLIHWICIDDSGLGGARLAGAPPTRELGRPMMLLNVVSEFCGTDTSLREKYRQQLEWSVDTIQEHVRLTLRTHSCTNYSKGGNFGS